MKYKSKEEHPGLVEKKFKTNFGERVYFSADTVSGQLLIWSK